MKAGTLLCILADVINLLKTNGMITPTGDFGDFSNIQQDTNLIKGIESILSQYKVTVPNRVDEILALIPAIANLIKG